MRLVNPIILLVIDETMKIQFQGLIGIFVLTINLLMIARIVFTINLEEPKQVIPKFQKKLWALNINDLIKKTMMLKHFTHNQICYLLTINSFCT